MLEEVRAEIHKSGITIGDPGSKDYRVLQAGETIDFSSMAHLRLGQDSLLVSPMGNSNSVEVIFRGKSRLLRGFYPEGTEASVEWRDVFGEDPNEDSFVDFKDPKPVMTVRYLGHAIRDVLLPLMERQASQPDTTRAEDLDLYGNGLIHRVVASSPVISTEVVPYTHRYPGNDQPGYRANIVSFMTTAWWGRERRFHQLKLFTAAVAESDNLLRFYEEVVSDFSSGKLDKFLPRMAEVSLFLQRLGTGKTPDAGTGVIDLLTRRNRVKWQTDQFPLRILGGLQSYLYDSDSGSFQDQFFMRDGFNRTLKARYGFDWRRLKEGFSQRDLATESSRLRTVIYEQYPVLSQA